MIKIYIYIYIYITCLNHHVLFKTGWDENSIQNLYRFKHKYDGTVFKAHWH